MADDPQAKITMQSYDPTDRTGEDALYAELEQNLPLVLHCVGAAAFIALCKQLLEIYNRIEPGEAFVIEKNTQKDGAFLYVGTHSFDVVHELRKRMGVTHDIVEEGRAQAKADVSAKRKERN